MKRSSEINYHKIQINDTIILKSPTRVTEGVSQIFYWNPGEKRLVPKICAMVLFKNKVDNHVLFIIRILDSYDTHIKIGSEFINVDDTLEVDIYNYGNEIELQNAKNHRP